MSQPYLKYNVMQFKPCIVKVVYSPPKGIMSCSPDFAKASTIYGLQSINGQRRKVSKYSF